MGLRRTFLAPPGQQLTPLAMTRVRPWAGLPLRWSGGIRRRARRIWRMGKGLDAAAIERLAERFADGCLEAVSDLNFNRSARWLRTLSACGFHAEAVTLQQRLTLEPEQTTSSGPANAQAAQLDALCDQLQAVLARVRDLFERDLQSLPTAIDATDARLAAVRAWLNDLPSDACVADLGCGSGRFLRAMRDDNAHMRLFGIDVAASMMASLPPRIEGIVGNILNLPMIDGAFDALISIEALEHSLRPSAAVAEMLRVLRPGGRLLMIDKHRQFQATCEHEPWEHWFELDDVVGWLSPYARVERCELLPADGRDVPEGLFCLWTAVKHG